MWRSDQECRMLLPHLHSSSSSSSSFSSVFFCCCCFWYCAAFLLIGNRQRSAKAPHDPVMPALPLYLIPHLFLTVYFDFVFLNCGHSRKLFLSTGHDVNKWAFVLIFIPTHEHEYGQIALHTHTLTYVYLDIAGRSIKIHLE